MEGNYVVQSNDSENHNASFVSMTTANQMIPTANLYISEPNTTALYINTSQSYINTPIVKSHHNMYASPPIGAYLQQQQQQQQQQQTIETTNTMNNFNSMEIDDLFTPPLMENTPLLDNNHNMFIYSPLSTSFTTNSSSVVLMDNVMSPTSPTNGMSPMEYSTQQSIDNPYVPAPNYYSEAPVVPVDVGMYPMRPVASLPRRHTVSLPYPNIVDSLPPPPTKSRKSSLKAKRHRSLGKLDTYNDSSPPPVPDFEPLSAKLESWTHEQLLERVKELEKEKEEAQKHNKDDRPTLHRKASGKVRSASHTDTEVEDDDDEEDGPHTCKWDTCTIEFMTLNDLINHVKLDHIGSGKGSYYCCWKDCARKQKPFTKKHKMHNHLRTHTGEKPFACEELDCGKRFSRLDSLTTHAKIHLNIRPYLCNVADCGKAYYHLRSLRKHERSHLQSKEGTVSPPPLPSMVTHTATTASQLDGFLAPQVITDWGLSAQAAVFDVIDRNSYL